MKYNKFALFLLLSSIILFAANHSAIAGDHVIINQFLGGDGGYTSHNFIELYNPTDKTVSLQGWAVHYRSAPADNLSSDKWYKLNLSGEIPSRHSYLIQCAQDNNYPSKTKYSGRDIAGDITWDASIFNKGVSIILTSNDSEISSNSEIFDNESGRPLISGYVDMLAASGNDGTDSQIPPAFETSSSAIQSKKKSIRRVNFQDTDNNANDSEAVDYSVDNISDYFPRNLASGQWGVNDDDNKSKIIAEIQAVRKNIPRFYTTYCTNESAAALTDFLAELDSQLEDENISSETLESLLTQLNDLTGKLIFLSDDVIPQIFIATDNGSGDSYGDSLVRSIGYVPAQIVCVSTDGSIMAQDLTWDSQIKVRGNMTANGAKKPYNIKFSSKVNLFGFGKAKKWTLLADYYDKSFMRNKIALELAKRFGLDATMDYHRVELYIDGRFNGLYLLTEKIEADKNRVNINTDNGDFILEMELPERAEEGNIYLTTSDDKFYRVRDPEDESQVTTIKSKIDEFEQIIKSGSWDQVSEIIDIDSFTEYYIHNEIMKPIDFYQWSMYLYYHDGKFYAGPVWDYDLSAGNHSRKYKNQDINDPSTIYIKLCHYFSYLTRIPEFNSAVFKKFINLSDILGEIYESGGWIDSDLTTYNDAINRNLNTWGGTATYNRNINTLKSWLKTRHNFLKQYFYEPIKIESEDSIYYLSYNGVRTNLGFIIYNGAKYFAGEGGKLSTGFFEQDDSYYYAEYNGKILSGDFTINNFAYKTDSEGKIQPQSLDITISGDEVLNLNTGESGSITFTASAGKFYGPSLASKTINNYSLTWTLETNISGISLSESTLNINNSLTAGNYIINITASAESGDLKGSTSKIILVNVKDPAFSLTASQNFITAVKQESITAVNITSEAQNLSWSYEGSLPDGLTYTQNGNKIIISGTPEDDSPAKIYEFTVTASNGTNTASEKIFITVKDIAPVISQTAHEIAIDKCKYTSLNITAAQGTNLSWSYNGILPAGLEFISSDMSAQITGVTQMGSSGVYELEIIAANSEGTASSKIIFSISGSLENDNNLGDSDPPVNDITENGENMTLTHTVFRNSAGFIILSADVAITTKSNNYNIYKNNKFSQLVSVDVILEVADSDYNNYIYSMDIAGLPKWLKVLGDTASSDTLSTGTTEYHHVLTLSGKPLTVQDTQTINLYAVITISGDNLQLQALASKDVNITVMRKINEIYTPVPSQDSDSESDSDSEIYLLSLNAALSANNKISLTEGESKSLVINPSVNAIFSDGSAKSLNQSEYIYSWEYNFYADGISFNDGTLNILSSAKSGNYNIPVKFLVTSGDVSCEASITLNVNITPRQDEQTPGGIIIDNIQSISELISSMTDSQLQQITSLTLNENIKDLSGLEKLTNLEELDLTGAINLESINLSGNTSIKRVILSGNKGIKTLDLSGSNIEILDAHDCENLQKLNITGCESLVYLNVSGTDLISLNARDCKNLETLDFSDCSVSDLNLEGCESITYLDCNHNALTKLDASIFPVLQELSCSNQIINNWESSKIFTASFINDSDSDSARIINLQAWDSSGNSISAELDSATGIISFERTPAKFSYDYITGFEDILMDVIIYSDLEADSDSESDSSSNNNEIPDDNESDFAQNGGGGGCNSGLNILCAILCLALMNRKR